MAPPHTQTMRRSLHLVVLSCRLRSARIYGARAYGLAGRRERGDKLGILKTVQPHARSRRAFGTSVTAVELEALVPTTNHAEKLPLCLAIRDQVTAQDPLPLLAQSVGFQYLCNSTVRRRPQ